MSLPETRTHIVLPTELVERVDRLVGARKRSRFFAAAVAKEAARLELLAAAGEAAGSMADIQIPGWETSESIAQWVYQLRQAEITKLDALDRLRSAAAPTPQA